MYTNMSALGLGTVVIEQDAPDKHRAVTYARRALNQAESNYSLTHQEKLAIVWSQTFSGYYPRLPYYCLYRSRSGH